MKSSSIDYDVRALVKIGAVALAGVASFTYLRHRRKSKRRHDTEDFPNLPPPGPTFQEYLEVLKQKRGTELQEEWNIKYGPCFTIRSPSTLLIPNIVVVADPPTVRELTIKQANMYRDPSRFTTRSPAFAAATRNAVGTSVTGLVGEEWRWRKDALIREFHRSRLLSDDRGLLDVMIREGKRLCDDLDVASERDEAVAVDVLTTRAAVGVVLFFLFGRRLDFDPEEMRDAAKDLLDYLGFQLGNPLHFVLKYLPFSQSWDAERKKRRAWAVVDNIVRPEIEQLVAEADGAPVPNDRMPGSVLASLIAKEPRFTSGGVSSMIAEARVFVQAGFETTAHSLAFALGMLAERPDLADRINMEGTAALRGDISKVSVPSMKSALENTPTAKHVFLEAVRMFPLAPALGGLCTDDIVISPSGSSETYGLRKGTALLFQNLVLQRHPKYARGSGDPNVIEPERWNAKPSEQPFLHTFNNGPHSCPGKPLSMLEGHVFLLMAATQFKFEFPPDAVKKVEYEEDILLRPKGGMRLIVRKRK